jgi:tetratricopeptide (TPR) repeat protein
MIRSHAVESVRWRRWMVRRAAAGLILLAAAAWLSVLYWRYRTEPEIRHLRAGMEYARQGQAKAAEREWLAVVQRNPNHRDAWELLGELYFSAQIWPNAAHAFQNLLRIAPQTPAAHARLAASLLCAGDERGAFEQAKQELQRNPDDLSSLAICVYVLSYMGDDKQLLEYLRRLERLQPDDLEFLTMLAEVLASKRRHDEARPILDRILQLDPNNAQALSMRGFGWFEQNPDAQSFARAEADLLQALRINPLMPFARYGLGRLYQRMGRHDRAVFQLEQAAKLVPDKSDVFFALASSYQAVGNEKKAEMARQRFQQLRSDAERESRLEKRCAADPSNFDLHLQMGELTLRRGDARKARYYLQRAAALKPDDPRPQKALEEFEKRFGALHTRQTIQSRIMQTAPRTPEPTVQP